MPSAETWQLSMTFCTTMQSYYPWNTEALATWLRQELRHHEKHNLETRLKIQKHVIRAWLTNPAPPITLAHIRAIAEYRGWHVNQVIDWLQIRPSHRQELFQQHTAEATITSTASARPTDQAQVRPTRYEF